MRIVKTTLICLLLMSVGYFFGYVAGSKDSDRRWSVEVDTWADRLLESLSSKGYQVIPTVSEEAIIPAFIEFEAVYGGIPDSYEIETICVDSVMGEIKGRRNGTD